MPKKKASGSQRARPDAGGGPQAILGAGGPKAVSPTTSPGAERLINWTFTPVLTQDASENFHQRAPPGRRRAQKVPSRVAVTQDASGDFHVSSSELLRQLISAAGGELSTVSSELKQELVDIQPLLSTASSSSSPHVSPDELAPRVDKAINELRNHMNHLSATVLKHVEEIEALQEKAYKIEQSQMMQEIEALQKQSHRIEQKHHEDQLQMAKDSKSGTQELEGRIIDKICKSDEKVDRLEAHVRELERAVEGNQAARLKSEEDVERFEACVRELQEEVTAAQAGEATRELLVKREVAACAHQLLEEVAALHGGEIDLRRLVLQVEIDAEVSAVYLADQMQMFELVMQDNVARLCTLEGSRTHDPPLS